MIRLDGTWKYHISSTDTYVNIDRSPMHSFDDCGIHKDDLPMVIEVLSRLLLESVTEHKEE